MKLIVAVWSLATIVVITGNAGYAAGVTERAIDSAPSVRYFAVTAFIFIEYGVPFINVATSIDVAVPAAVLANHAPPSKE